MTSDTDYLKIDDATKLAHALAGILARESCARVLSIKGPASDQHRLRSPRVSSDADVLVHPDDFEKFCALLEGRGWHTRYGRETPSLLPSHSRTYIHDNWSCDIDVHSSFPGFFAAPAAAFNALWESRVVLAVAHVDAFAPSRAGSAVVTALHAQRSSQSERHRAEGEHVRQIIASDFRDDEKEEFYRIARAGGAVWVLQDLITTLELGPIVLDAKPDDQRLWTLNRDFNEDGSTLGWLLHWKQARWSRRFSILARAIWVSRADVPRNDPLTLPTRRETWRYRFDRWNRGRVALLRYLSRTRTPNA